MGFAAAAAATAIALTTSVSPAAVAENDDPCAWRHAALRLHQELAGESSERADPLRQLLTDAGVGEPGFIPEQCQSERDGRERPDSARSSVEAPDEEADPSTEIEREGLPPDRLPSPGASPTPTAGSAGTATSAAERHGWGKPDHVDEFDSASLAEWSVYNGPGHAGNGRRTPEAVSVSDGVLTITGDSQGNTAGMAWNPGQMYGRWEGRVQAPASDETYNALLLLWPDAENFPVGGEVDFMEMMDHTRQSTELFLHYGADNSQVHGQVKVDATEWHNWALEWSPEKITAFLDGEEWWSTTDTNVFPPGPMHLCVQLDWFPDNGTGGVQQSAMHVDWVKQYSLNPGEAPSTEGQGSEGSTAADSSTSITDEINSGARSGDDGSPASEAGASSSASPSDGTDS